MTAGPSWPEPGVGEGGGVLDGAADVALGLGDADGGAGRPAEWPLLAVAGGGRWLVAITAATTPAARMSAAAATARTQVSGFRRGAPGDRSCSARRA